MGVFVGLLAALFVLGTLCAGLVAVSRWLADCLNKARIARLARRECANLDREYERLLRR